MILRSISLPLRVTGASCSAAPCGTEDSGTRGEGICSVAFCPHTLAGRSVCRKRVSFGPSAYALPGKLIPCLGMGSVGFLRIVLWASGWNDVTDHSFEDLRIFPVPFYEICIAFSESSMISSCADRRGPDRIRLHSMPGAFPRLPRVLMILRASVEW